MSAFLSLEKKLDELFVKNAPALPSGGKKWLVKYLPWINLVLGILTLLAVLSLWRAGHTVNELVDYANTLSQAYGGEAISNVNNLGVGYWLALIVLAIEAVLYIVAFPLTRDRKKIGWDIMFYALLINLAYGVLAIFTDYAGVGSFIGALIGSAIGGYLLFQIRTSYGIAAPKTARAKKA